MMSEGTSNASNTPISSVLEDFFRKIIAGQSVEIDLNQAYEALVSLNVNLDVLNLKVKTALPFLLIHLIRSWPGWQKSSAYNNNEITFEVWMGKFKEYLSFKLNFILMNELEKVCKDTENVSIDNDYLFGIHNSTQTEPECETCVAPYSIKIEAPARFLNTLTFTESGNDIVIKEYKHNLLWDEKLTTRQLINWPNIEIEFRSTGLHFTRRNAHDIQRFLTYGAIKIPANNQDNCIIEDVELINAHISRKCYSLNLIKEYCQLYIEVLKEKRELANVSESRVQEVEIILEDLMLDLLDINMNSIPTNTRVLFNIGNSSYDRNQRAKSRGEPLCITDFIKPKTLLSFISFTAFKNSSSDPFPVLTNIQKDTKKNHLKDIIPTIFYRCTFCHEEFNNDEDVWQHLKTLHVMELPVLCFQCEMQFTISTLTQHRWRHKCVDK